MNYRPLLNPQTIAVVGVSLTNDRHPANVIYNKIHLRYPVKVYPVNPKGGRLQRDRVYEDISRIPGKIDLAVVAARADFVPDILESCIQNGVGGASVISGGFAEIGRVNDEWELDDLHDDMKWSAGIGARIMVEGVIVRVDFATSEEQSEVQMFIGQTF